MERWSQFSKELWPKSHVGKRGKMGKVHQLPLNTPANNSFFSCQNCLDFALAGQWRAQNSLVELLKHIMFALCTKSHFSIHAHPSLLCICLLFFIKCCLPQKNSIWLYAYVWFWLCKTISGIYSTEYFEEKILYINHSENWDYYRPIILFSEMENVYIIKLNNAPLKCN